MNNACHDLQMSGEARVRSSSNNGNSKVEGWKVFKVDPCCMSRRSWDLRRHISYHTSAGTQHDVTCAVVDCHSYCVTVIHFQTWSRNAQEYAFSIYTITLQDTQR